jgi:hypothetical protein
MEKRLLELLEALTRRFVESFHPLYLGRRLPRITYRIIICTCTLYKAIRATAPQKISIDTYDVGAAPRA